MRRLLSLIALAATATVQAQGSGASAPVSATKKALVQRVLKLQQPGIEALARQLAEQPAAAMVQQVQPALARVPADKREAVARDIQADIRKYADEATPLVRDRAGRRRDFDINIDGFAHYGLLPDFLQDMVNSGLSTEDLAPLFRSANDYVEMWAKCDGMKAK